MLPSTMLQTHREDVKRIMKQYPRLAALRVCGSVARGEDSEKSDIDFLVEPGPEATLFDLGGLREDLEELLGVPVDVISSGSRMDAAMRDALLSEAVSL